MPTDLATRRGVSLSVASMAAATALSNYLMRFPINPWLTWGAFVYPVTFLVNELTNRAYGPVWARRAVYAGFTVGLSMSWFVAPTQVALGSSTAFLVAQLADIAVFSRMRQRGGWWQAPLAASVLASALDTVVFFSIAFWGTQYIWWKLALGDFAIKLVMDTVMLGPFRIALRQRGFFDSKSDSR